MFRLQEQHMDTLRTMVKIPCKLDKVVSLMELEMSFEELCTLVQYSLRHIFNVGVVKYYAGLVKSLCW